MIEQPSKENLIELAEIAGNLNNSFSLEQREELWSYIMEKASNLPNEKDGEKLRAMKEKYENHKNNTKLSKSLSMEESEESHRAAPKKSSQGFSKRKSGKKQAEIIVNQEDDHNKQARLIKQNEDEWREIERDHEEYLRQRDNARLEDAVNRNSTDEFDKNTQRQRNNAQYEKNSFDENVQRQRNNAQYEKNLNQKASQYLTDEEFHEMENAQRLRYEEFKKKQKKSQKKIRKR